MADTAQKVVTLASLGKAIEKIKGDFATKEELATVSSKNVEYATEEEVLALFTEAATASEG